MAERKRMTSVLSRLATDPDRTGTPQAPAAPATRPKQRLFDRLNASSPLDAEPDLARIAREVSTFTPPDPGRPGPGPDTPPAPASSAPPSASPAAETSAASLVAPAASLVAPAASRVAPADQAADRPETPPGPAAQAVPPAARPEPQATPAAPMHSPSVPLAAGRTDGEGETDNLHGQTTWSDHMDGPCGQTTPRSDRMVEPSGPSERSDQTDHAGRPFGQTKRIDQMDGPDGQTVQLAADRPLAKTRQQKAVFDYLAAHPNILTSVNNLSGILDMPPPTLRKTLTLFAKAGVLRKTRVGNDGLRIVFAAPQGSAHMVRPSGQTMRSDHSPSLIEREDLSFSLSSEDMALHWPNLVRQGFGPDQLDHIRASLAKVGKSADRVVQGLDHIEYELANGLLVDKDGHPVLDPCSWAFRALAQNGYYRRPKGYVSPAEQAALDAEAEARAVHQARQRQEQAAFEAWKAGLSPEQLRRAMAGHPGGPKDVWLRAQWRKRPHPDESPQT